MGRRLCLLAVLLTLSVTALGCSAGSSASPSSEPGSAGAPSIEPTSTPTAPTSTPDGGGLPQIGCLGPRPDLAAILAVDASQRPACFGRANLTFQAVVVGAATDCVPIQVQPRWLWCPPAAFLAVPGTASWPESDDVAHATGSASGGPIFAAAAVPLLEMYAAPGSGIGRGQFADGTKVQVVGHFDDPAASTCRLLNAQPGIRAPTPAEVVLACRQAFVALAVRRASAMEVPKSGQ
jgi:hypothetical protein